ncbi:MAG: hypothetical protein ACREXR_20725, partial [Gammaproteobacteria bacterium]
MSYSKIRATLRRIQDVDGKTEGWVYIEQGITEHFDASGRLTTLVSLNGDLAQLSYLSDVPNANRDEFRVARVEDDRGRAIEFLYNDAGNIASAVGPGGETYSYVYDELGQLAAVDLPGTSRRTYHYNEEGLSPGSTAGAMLTGITDESGQRFKTFKYENGSAKSSERAGGTNKLEVQFYSGTSVRMIGPLGEQQDRTYTAPFGVPVVSSIRRSCLDCADSLEARTYDDNGYPDTATDASGVLTDHDYDLRGLPTQRIDAANDASTRRTTRTVWHSEFDRPVERTILDASNTAVSKLSWTYNARGQILSAT